jgi:hypothetical protein
MKGNSMNRKLVLREGLIFLATCVAYFALAAVLSLFGFVFVALAGFAPVGIPVLYLFFCAFRLTRRALSRS